MFSWYVAQAFSKWLWNSPIHPCYYCYHLCFYIPHALYFYCKVYILESSRLLFKSHFCLLKLQRLLTYMFPFHYHGLKCLVCCGDSSVSLYSLLGSRLQDGIIAKSDSPWNSPLLVVPKNVGPDGKRKWRLVVDFRILNEKTVGGAYPLPHITEILDQLGQSKYFTCLDMVMGYHQIELAPGEGPKTVFSTKQGHWEYRRLPWGYKRPLLPLNKWWIRCWVG